MPQRPSLIADFLTLTLEVIAERMEETWPPYTESGVAILPNPVVIKHCLHLSAFHGGEVELFPAWNSDLGTGTIWAVAHAGEIEQLVWLSADDGEAVEFVDRQDALEFLHDSGDLEGRWLR